MMRTLNLLMLVVLCGVSSLNYADRYNSMLNANSPPTTFEDDPAASNNAFSPEIIEKPAIPVPAPIKKQPMAYTPPREEEKTTPCPCSSTEPDAESKSPK